MWLQGIVDHSTTCNGGTWRIHTRRRTCTWTCRARAMKEGVAGGRKRTTIPCPRPNAKKTKKNKVVWTCRWKDRRMATKMWMKKKKNPPKIPTSPKVDSRGGSQDSPCSKKGRCTPKRSKSEDTNGASGKETRRREDETKRYDTIRWKGRTIRRHEREKSPRHIHVIRTDACE